MSVSVCVRGVMCYGVVSVVCECVCVCACECVCVCVCVWMCV